MRWIDVRWVVCGVRWVVCGVTYWLDWVEFILGFFKYHSGGLVNVGPVPHDDANLLIEVPLAFTPVPV